jgi:glycosyltransferase involved in cell wall biosynthesis
MEITQNRGFDVVHFHNQFSAWYIPIVQKIDIPAVYSLHNPLWYDSKACSSAYQRLKFFQDIRAMRRADVVICLNETIGKNIAHYFGNQENRIAVIPNGISQEWFTDTTVPESLVSEYKPNGEKVVLNVARIAPYKNQFTLVRAIPLIIKKIPEARFLFAGPISDSNYYHQIHRYMNQARIMLYASFIGEIPYLELPKFYALSDCAVIPSSSEAMPTVTLEAMAQKRPVIASDIEPFRNIVTQETGMIVPVFDHEALANAVITLLKNKSLRQDMGLKAKEYVRSNYTWDNIVKKVLNMYENLVGGTTDGS